MNDQISDSEYGKLIPNKPHLDKAAKISRVFKAQL